MSMCLQFDLPSGAGGLAAIIASGKIKKMFTQLKRENKIIDFKATTEKPYKYNVWLKEEKEYTIYFLLLDNENFYSTPRIVDKPDSENPFL